MKLCLAVRTAHCIAPPAAQTTWLTGCTLVGVVAGSEAALASAIRKALELQPRCLTFFIDRCDRFPAPAFLQQAAGERTAVGVPGIPASYMVFAKRLQPTAPPPLRSRM